MGVVDGLREEDGEAGSPPTAGRRRAAAGAFALYLAIALAVTWPWLADPGGVSFGVTYGDLGSHIGRPAAWAREGQMPWLPGTLDGLDAPEGFPVQWALNLAAAPSLTLLMVLAAAFGGVAANGIWVVAGFTLTAWSMFLLARRLTGRADAALVAGLAFGFWPYAYATVSQPLGHGWVLVVLVWRMIVLLERPTIRNGMWAGGAVVLAMWWVQYWLLIAGVAWVSLAALGLVVAARRNVLGSALRAQGTAAAPVVLLLSGLAAAGLATGFDDVPVRDAGDQSLYSARVAMYLVPGPHNPLAGRWTQAYLNERFGLPSSDAFYNPIYLGISTLLLAGLGAAILVRSRRRPGARPIAPIAACAAMGAVALVMSAPPTVRVLGLSIPMPSLLLGEVTTAFRTSARFGHLVMLAVCVLAAVGVAAILRGRPPVLAAALTVLLGLLIFADLWGRDPHLGSPVRIEVPATVSTLAELPRGVVATYPLLPSTIDRSGPGFAAVSHRQPVFNGYRQGTPSETRKLGLARLTLPWVPAELSAYGVRYVLVESPAATSGLEGLPPPSADVPGLRRLGADGYATLYEVVARPASEMALARSGFSFVEGSGASAFRYMTARTGEIELRSDCDGCLRELRFHAAAVSVPRRLVVRDASGAVLLRTSVSLDSTPIRVPVSVSRRTTVSLTVDPPPGRVSPVDYREAGILVNVRLRLVAPRSTPDGPVRGAPSR